MKLWRIGVVAAVLTAGLIYFFFDPVSSGLFPRCPFLVLTGLKCPGCGSQRAVHALLHLDIVSAVRYNALLVVSLPVVAVLAYAEYQRERKPELYMRVNNRTVIMVCFAVIVAWWMARNIFGW